MPDTLPDDDEKKTSAPSDPAEGPGTGLPVTLTLEDIIDLTGEMEHLNELVLLILDKEGGFTTPEAYFARVRPVLDLLEVEIRVRCRTCRSKNEMKLIIRDWIDEEIRALR
jgi:hypothetical protein